MASARFDVNADDPAVGDHVLLVRRNVAYQTFTGHHPLGNPALDGCGWVVEVASIIYKPQNLLPEYKIDSLEVKMKYKVLDSVNCGLVKNAHNAIFIEEIHRKK